MEGDCERVVWWKTQGAAIAWQAIIIDVREVKGRKPDDEDVLPQKQEIFWETCNLELNANKCNKK